MRSSATAVSLIFIFFIFITEYTSAHEWFYPRRGMVRHRVRSCQWEGVNGQSSSEQEPGPRGSPQEPHGPACIEGAAPLFADTANTESCGASFLLWHFGHAALSLPKTSASNSCWHSWQMYSKIGIGDSRQICKVGLEAGAAVWLASI